MRSPSADSSSDEPVTRTQPISVLSMSSSRPTSKHYTPPDVTSASDSSHPPLSPVARSADPPVTSGTSPEIKSPTLPPRRSSSLGSPSLRRLSRHSFDGGVGAAGLGTHSASLPSQVAQYAVSPPTSAAPVHQFKAPDDGVDGHEPGHPWDSAWPGTSTEVQSPPVPGLSGPSSKEPNASPTLPARPSTPPVRLSPSAVPLSRCASRSPEMSARYSRRSPRLQPAATPGSTYRRSSDSGEPSAIDALVRRTSSRSRSGSASSGNSSNSASSGSSFDGPTRLPPAQAQAFANLEGPPSAMRSSNDIADVLDAPTRQSTGTTATAPIHIPHQERAGHAHASPPSGFSPGAGNGSSLSPSSSMISNSDGRLSGSPIMLRSPASPGLSAARIYAASGPPATLSSPRLAGMRVSTDAATAVFAGNHSPVAFPPGVGSGSPNVGPSSPAGMPPGAHAPPGSNAADTSQSPPQNRSFIGMPPRSGYELSDDPDDVGSESDDSASISSSRGSTGGNTDDEQDADGDGETGDDDGFDRPPDRERRQQQVLARVRALMEDDDADSDRLARHLGMSHEQAHEQQEGSSPTHEDPNRLDSEYTNEKEHPSSEERDYEDLERAYTQRQAKRGSRTILQINPALLIDGVDHLDQADAEWTPDNTEDQTGSVAMQQANGTDMPSPPDAIGIDGDAEPEAMEDDDSSAHFEDDNLSPLERIFMYAKSEMTYHRVLVARSLYEWIFDVELTDAVEYILPLLNGLGTDELDVCSAFVPNLHLIMWYFLRNCPLMESEADSGPANESEPADTARKHSPSPQPPEVAGFGTASGEHERPETAQRPRIHVATFTPLLCSLLLNQNTMVAEAAQFVLKQFVARLHVGPADTALLPLIPTDAQDTITDDGPLLPAYQPTRQDLAQESTELNPPDLTTGNDPDNADLVGSIMNREGVSIQAEPYTFGRPARQAVEHEIVENVAFAIGRLPGESGHLYQPEGQQDEKLPSVGSWEMPHFADLSAPGRRVNSGVNSSHNLPAQTTAESHTTIQEETAHNSSAQDVDMPLQDHVDQDHVDHDHADEDHADEEQTDEDQEMGDHMGGNEDSIHSRNYSEGVKGGNLTIFDSFSNMQAEAEDKADSDRMSDEIDINTEATVRRMSSVSLLSALVSARIFDVRALEMRILPEIIRLRSDSAYFVRKEVALLLAAVAKSLGDRSAQPVEQHLPALQPETLEPSSVIHQRRSNIVQGLLTTFDRLRDDKIWHVRQGICLAIPSLFAQVEDVQERRTKVVEALRYLSTDVSRQVRSAVLEVMGELIYLFHDTPAGPPPELVRYFKGEPFDLDKGDGADTSDSPGADESMGVPSSGDMHDPYTLDEPWRLDLNATALSSLERPLVCAFNFPAVVLTLGKSAWPDLRCMHAELAQNSSIKARRSLAASLHELAKIIEPDDTARDLLPLFDMFVLWDDAEVRSAAIEHVDQLLIYSPQREAESKLQLLREAWTAVFARDWRVRERLAELIPALAPKFLLSDEEGNLVALTQLALSDSVASVRVVGARAVPVLHETFGQCDSVLADGFLGMISDMADAERYRHRLSFLAALQALIDANLPRAALNTILLPRLMRLGQEEKVVDVRINLARVVADLCGSDSKYYPPSEERPPELDNLCRSLVQDKSQQVRQVLALALPCLSGGETMCSRREVDEEDEPPRRRLVLGPADGGPHRPTLLNQSDDEHSGDLGASDNFGQLSSAQLYGLDTFAPAQDTVHVPLQGGPNQTLSAYQMWQRPSDTEEESDHPSMSHDGITESAPHAAAQETPMDPDDDWVSTMDVGANDPNLKQHDYEGSDRKQK